MTEPNTKIEPSPEPKAPPQKPAAETDANELSDDELDAVTGGQPCHGVR